jgi:uncharacterized coiled-coil protein SlyX
MNDLQSLSQRLNSHKNSQDRAIQDLIKVVQEACKVIGTLQKQYQVLYKQHEQRQDDTA